jgi:hypothetical protein
MMNTEPQSAYRPVANVLPTVVHIATQSQPPTSSVTPPPSPPPPPPPNTSLWYVYLEPVYVYICHRQLLLWNQNVVSKPHACKHFTAPPRHVTSCNLEHADPCKRTAPHTSHTEISTIATLPSVPRNSHTKHQRVLPIAAQACSTGRGNTHCCTCDTAQLLSPMYASRNSSAIYIASSNSVLDISSPRQPKLSQRPSP